MAPYHIPDNDEDTPIVMAISWGNGSRNASTFCVILNESGSIIEFKKLDKLSDRDHSKHDVEILIEMIAHHRPDAIAIGGFAPNTKTAKIYMSSESGKREFPEADYPPLIPYCVSLARFVQEPTSEYACLFNKNEDIRHIRLDPLQKYLSDDVLMKAIERSFINVVNHVGVDIVAASSSPHLEG